MPKGDMYLDRRKHKRAQAKLSVSYKVMADDEFDKSLSEAQRRKKVETEDISTTGLQLICDEELAKDKIIRLDVTLKGTTDTIATFAEVKWIRMDDVIKKYRVGLQFLVVKEDHIAAIRKITGE